MPASPHDTHFDELGYLDRARVSDAKVNKLAGGKVIDGGGYASCMDVKGPCECNVG